ncbi:hypothetical protein, partial [Bradyrhizobium sp. 49]|uniref:hypothetical protein n=2 Tax=unclassified Bradyrhizobium TaxID=2631580 RepID=UPI001FF9E565
QGQPLGYLRREFVLPGLPKQTVSFVLAEMTRLHHVAVELLGQAEPHTSEIAAALAASRKAELPMVLPMRISQLCSGALGPNSSIILRDNNSPPRRVWLEFLRLRASAAELDFEREA